MIILNSAIDGIILNSAIDGNLTHTKKEQEG